MMCYWLQILPAFPLPTHDVLLRGTKPSEWEVLCLLIGGFQNIHSYHKGKSLWLIWYRFFRGISSHIMKTVSPSSMMQSCCKMQFLIFLQYIYCLARCCQTIFTPLLLQIIELSLPGNECGEERANAICKATVDTIPEVHALTIRWLP
mgnify:CR=1 FL=1